MQTRHDVLVYEGLPVANLTRRQRMLDPQCVCHCAGVLYAVDVAIKTVLLSQGIKFPGPLVSCSALSERSHSLSAHRWT